jgi:hypothetical protein
MKAQTIFLKTPEEFEKVLLAYSTLVGEADYPIDVTIKNHDTSIVSAQRGLYWRWIDCITKTTGDTKIEFHNQRKEDIFLNVYIADIENHPTFDGIVQAMQIIKAKAPDQFRTLRASVIHGISHLDATKANWHVVFNCLEVIASDLNVKLPVTERKGVLK